MTHPDGLPDDAPDHARRVLDDKKAHATLMRAPRRKPSNWWAFEREPWKRVNAEIVAAEKASADRERADRALRTAFAFAGAALALANAPCWAAGNEGAASMTQSADSSMKKPGFGREASNSAHRLTLVPSGSDSAP